MAKCCSKFFIDVVANFVPYTTMQPDLLQLQKLIFSIYYLLTYPV